jgi:hypothetical protein
MGWYASFRYKTINELGLAGPYESKAEAQRNNLDAFHFQEDSTPKPNVKAEYDVEVGDELGL